MVEQTVFTVQMAILFFPCAVEPYKILVSWSFFKPQTRRETNVGIFTLFAHDKRRF